MKLSSCQQREWYFGISNIRFLAKNYPEKNLTVRYVRIRQMTIWKSNGHCRNYQPKKKKRHSRQMFHQKKQRQSWVFRSRIISLWWRWQAKFYGEKWIPKPLRQEQASCPLRLSRLVTTLLQSLITMSRMEMPWQIRIWNLLMIMTGKRFRQELISRTHYKDTMKSMVMMAIMSNWKKN